MITTSTEYKCDLCQFKERQEHVHGFERESPKRTYLNVQLVVGPNIAFEAHVCSECLKEGDQGLHQRVLSRQQLLKICINKLGVP